MGNIFRQRRVKARAVHFAEQCALWLEQLFDQAYADLASQGHADAPGSAEYARVKAEWYADGIPADVWGFVQQRANLASPSAPLPTLAKAKFDGTYPRST